MSDTHTAERPTLVTKDMAAKIAHQTLTAEGRYVSPTLEAEEILDLYWHTRPIPGSQAASPGWREADTIPRPPAVGAASTRPWSGARVASDIARQEAHLDKKFAETDGAEDTSTGLAEVMAGIARASAEAKQRERDVRDRLRKARYLLRTSTALANMALAEMQAAIR